MNAYDEVNPDWQTVELPGWEPWASDDEDDVHEIDGCNYCGAPDVFAVEPFAQRDACRSCFELLVGESVPDRPMQCCIDAAARRAVRS